MMTAWHAEGHELFFGDGRHAQIDDERFAWLLAEWHNAAIRAAEADAAGRMRERAAKAADDYGAGTYLEEKQEAGSVIAANIRGLSLEEIPCPTT